MFFILLSGMVIFGLSAIILVLSPLVGMKSDFNMEKGSPFECGFDPMGAGHMDFSIRFFLIAIIFLIFDVEIAMLLPLYAITLSSLYKIWLTCNIVFLVILILGVFFEWKEGAFEWK